MCGVVGFVGGAWRSREHAAATISRMKAAITHRGPDSSDSWIDEIAGVALGHNRLSIVDLTDAGSQPMISASGRYVIVFNGEIYNHGSIRTNLGAGGCAPPWRGHSDTETLLAAIEAWGVTSALRQSVGMFAFGLWDRATRTLTLARDRLGEKPLYYGFLRAGAAFGFASELKALVQHPEFEGEIDRDALALLLRYNYIPAPLSIYHGIKKLPPGAFVEFRGGDLTKVEKYWSATEVTSAAGFDRLGTSPGEAIDALEEKLERAVSRQLMADVPLGAFLSGGIDSSTIVAIMQKKSARPVKTFTIGFREQEYNEAEHAAAVARHLGTEHTELYVTAAEARAVIPLLPTIYDEPFADSSQIPTYLVSKLARQQVTVALSGDGGDELFAGYTRYALTSKLWGTISKVPAPIRAAAARALTSISASAWTRLGHLVFAALPPAARFRHLGDKVHKGAPLLMCQSPDQLYQEMISLWRDPAALVIGANHGPITPTDTLDSKATAGPVDRMMSADLTGYLPDDILVKVDRAAMAVSLETRVPFLDHELVEFALRTPLSLKIRNGQTKWLLRQLLYRHVPANLIERPKMGFGVPIDAWLRGPLREWAENLLDERRLRNEGYFRAPLIRQAWEAHLSGRSNEQYRLWGILMFQSWLEHRASLNRIADEVAIA